MNPGTAIYLATAMFCVKKGIPPTDFVAIFEQVSAFFNVDREAIGKCMVEAIEAMVNLPS